MRKRKDSHDGSPVADTNLLFVPSSSDDSSESGVDALMGMIDEAGAQVEPPPPEVPLPPAPPAESDDSADSDDAADAVEPALASSTHEENDSEQAIDAEEATSDASAD